MIKSYTQFGYSYHHGSTSPANITTAYQVFPVTVDTTNSTNSASFPDDCNIQSIEFEVTTVGHGTSITTYLARDSAGNIPITNPSTENITVGVGAATKGGAIFSDEIDYHFDGGTGAGTAITGTSRGTIYVVAKKTDTSGTDATVTNIRVNWRA